MRSTIVLVDAHQLVREGLRVMMEARSDLDVIGEASDGREAVELCRRLAPDLAVVDAQLPRLSGIEVVRRIREGGVACRCVVLSGSHSSSLVRSALLAGASGIVPKTAPSADLFAALEAARGGRPFFVRSVGDDLAASLGRPGIVVADRPRLTGRQTQVLQLVAEGMSTREIARELGVSVKTAQTHRTTLMKKIGAHKASELVRYAIREGIVRA